MNRTCNCHKVAIMLWLKELDGKKNIATAAMDRGEEIMK